MLRFKYIGLIKEVVVGEKGLIKQGDVIEFTETEARGLSPENWLKVEMASFDKKDSSFAEAKNKQYKDNK